jgi:hypothetical protein
MPFSGTWRCVALVTGKAVTNNRSTLLYTTYSISSQRASVVSYCFSSSPILIALMMEAIRFSETSVLTRVTGRNIPEDGILRCLGSD